MQHRLTCLEDNFVTLDRQDMDQHVKSSHEVQNEDVDFACNVCNYKLTKNDDFKEHLKTHEKIPKKKEEVNNDEVQNRRSGESDDTVTKEDESEDKADRVHQKKDHVLPRLEFPGHAVPGHADSNYSELETDLIVSSVSTKQNLSMTAR